MRNKKNIVILCVMIPIVTALAFVPKMLKAHHKRTYTESF